MANPLAISLHDSAAETVSGVGPSIDIGATRSCVRLLLDISDLSAGASISVALETSRTGLTLWRAFGALGPSPDPVTIAFADRFVRARWTIAGSAPSVTFSISGEAHTLYATPRDIGRLSMPEKATGNVDACIKADACLAASDEADGALSGSFCLPLIAWGDDLRQQVSNIATFSVMRHRGFQPGGIDDLIVKASDDARSWLNKVSQGRIKPPGIIDSTPQVFEGGAVVVSKPRRGW